ncbi:hypothetical protein JAAARDRAFT_201037 [Jaapia argillacea MUCL 33604]|uniref:DUF6532 domain-containing protein n=1 Tax=Jaapia argillacea MUCL 33604 TaxID=933084 RepID=A0A067P393_9AGAM|nr:hypothetical protein JAAARDRAFT_201037 [Jaapia argillacea MUCL 33604]
MGKGTNTNTANLAQSSHSGRSAPTRATAKQQRAEQAIQSHTNGPEADEAGAEDQNGGRRPSRQAKATAAANISRLLVKPTRKRAASAVQNEQTQSKAKKTKAQHPIHPNGKMQRGASLSKEHAAANFDVSDDEDAEMVTNEKSKPKLKGKQLDWVSFTSGMLIPTHPFTADKSGNTGRANPIVKTSRPVEDEDEDELLPLSEEKSNNEESDVEQPESDNEELKQLEKKPLKLAEKMAYERPSFPGDQKPKDVKTSKNETRRAGYKNLIDQDVTFSDEETETRLPRQPPHHGRSFGLAEPPPLSDEDSSPEPGQLRRYSPLNNGSDVEILDDPTTLSARHASKNNPKKEWDTGRNVPAQIDMKQRAGVSNTKVKLEYTRSSFQPRPSQVAVKVERTSHGHVKVEEPTSIAPAWPESTWMVFPDSGKISLKAQGTLVRAILLVAIEELKDAVCFVDSFPEVNSQTAIVRDALLAAAVGEKDDRDRAAIRRRLRSDGEYLSDMAQIPEARIGTFRGKTKTAAASSLAHCFNLTPRAGLSKYITDLLSGDLYICPRDPVTSEFNPKKGYQAPILGSVLRTAFFDGSPSYAATRHAKFPLTRDGEPMVSPEMLALAATAVYAALTDWSTGEYKRTDFSASVYYGTYRKHIASLAKIEKNPTKYHKLLRKVYVLASGSNADHSVKDQVVKVDLSDMEVDD